MSAVLTACAHQHQEEGKTSPYDFSPLHDKIVAWVDSSYYTGASMIVAKNNEVIYEQYFGSYTPETQVYIASAGKWLAAELQTSLP